jgi:alpha-1,2-rhamnosyltransferase
MPTIKRIFLECTRTHDQDPNTGIQRVVRNFVRESRHIDRALNVACRPAVFRYGFFVDAGNWPPRRPGAANRRSASQVLLDAPHVPSGLKTRLRKRLYQRQRRITFGEGDLLLLLDTSIHLPLWPAVQRAKQQGARVGVFVHDLIPLTHAHLYPAPLVAAFKRWFVQALEYADFLLTNSRCVCEEVQSHASEAKPGRDWSECVTWVQLGAGLDERRRRGKVQTAVREAFAGPPSVYLMVGTLDPRKNHAYLLDAFDRVWAECPETRLCIVGRVGQGMEALLERFRSHPRYGDALFFFPNLSDTDLAYCYEHARALVFPSMVEGFGLPLVEALSYGLPVLASDIPVHREVGKTSCTFFDLDTPRSLAGTVLEWETGSGPPPASMGEDRQPSWEDSARDLLTKSLALAAKPAQPSA